VQRGRLRHQYRRNGAIRLPGRGRDIMAMTYRGPSPPCAAGHHIAARALRARLCCCRCVCICSYAVRPGADIPRPEPSVRGWTSYRGPSPPCATIRNGFAEVFVQAAAWSRMSPLGTIQLNAKVPSTPAPLGTRWIRCQWLLLEREGFLFLISAIGNGSTGPLEGPGLREP
jgi:hypothetical protein